MVDTPEQARSILFFSLSCVGDAVMTTPLLQSLHHHFPDAIIDIISDKRSAILYRYCPYVGKVFLKNKKKFLRGSVDLLGEVRKTYYDMIVDVRTDGLAYLCRGRKRFTKLDRKAYGPHAVEQLMGVIHSIHGEDKIPGTTVWLSEEETRFASAAVSTLPPGRWLAIAPAVAFPGKLWPVENYIRLANSLTDIFTAVILDGGPGEEAVTTKLAQSLRLPYVNLAGRTSLLQAAAMLRRASLFVGSDSGLGHVASAVSTPTLTLFSTHKPERVRPWGNRAEWLCSATKQASSISVEEVEQKLRVFSAGLAASTS